VDANIFVLHHDAAGLFQRRRSINGLIVVDGRCRKAFAQILFLAVAGDGEALHRTHIDAGVAFDSFRRDEDGLNIAVEAALYFVGCLLGREAEFHLDIQIGEAFD